MNGKIKTKFAALFAVALMITVCVVPVVGNEDVQAADVSSTIPEGISDIEIQLFTEDSKDFSDLIYCANDNKLPASVDPVEWKEYPANSGVFINVNKDSEYFGKFLRFGQTGLSNDEIIELGKDKWLPMIQTSYTYDVEGINIEISVTKDKAEEINDNEIVDTGSVSLQKAGAVFDKVECVSSIKFIGEFDEDSASICMGFEADLAYATGEYEVKVSTGGAVIASEKFAFESDADLLSIDGTVTDAGTTAIKGAKVAYKIGSTAGTAVTDENGNYEIKFKTGSVVEITGITYDGGAYTFTGGYVFGTLTDDIEGANFKANETTKSLKVVANGSSVCIDADVELVWYYQTESEKDDLVKYTIGTTAPKDVNKGTVEILGYKLVDDDNGEIFFTYLAPTFKSGVEEGIYSWALINKSEPEADGFEFTKAVMPKTSEDKEATSTSDAVEAVSLEDQIDENDGIQNALGNAVFESLSSVGVVQIKSNDAAETLGIVGADINLQWYYQTETTSDDDLTTYTISTTAPSEVNKGSVKILGKSDEAGNIKFTYIAPTEKADAEGEYDWALINTSAPDADGYTFTKPTMPKTSKETEEKDAVSLDDQIAAIEGLVDLSSGSGTMYAKEIAYEVSGSIIGIPALDDKGNYPEVTIKYTGGVGSALVLDKDDVKDGKYIYKFQVIKGNSCVITPTLAGYKFTPASFTTNSAGDNIAVPDFKAKSTAKETVFQPVSTDIGTVSVEFADEDVDDKLVVDLTYDVNGKQYTTPVLVTGADPYVATYDVAGIPGTYVELVSASAENYQFSLNANGKLTAGSSKIVTFFLSDAEDKPVKGVELTIFNGNKELGVIKSGEKGFATLEIPSGLDNDDVYGVFDEIYMVTFGVNDLGYWNANVQDYAEAETATVRIVYGSTFNNNTEYPGELDWSAIGGDNVEKAIGSKLDLKAPSIDGFEFVAWMVDGVVVSDKADYTLVVPAEGCDAVALYSAVHYEEPAEGLSMNVLVIGIVILILGILAVAYGIISKKQ